MSLPFKSASLQKLADAALKSKRVSLLPKSADKAQAVTDLTSTCLVLCQNRQYSINHLDFVVCTSVHWQVCTSLYRASCFHAVITGVLAVKASLQHVPLLLQAAKKYASQDVISQSHILYVG